jgi:hypothetical protein
MKTFGRPTPSCAAGDKLELQCAAYVRGTESLLEGFPELAHDDEVDACSGALAMLNPQMSSWGFEYYRQKAEELSAEQQRKPQPAPPNPAPGSMEWLAEQNRQKTSCPRNPSR